MGESLLKQAARLHGVEGLIEYLGVERFNLLRYEWSVWARPEQLPPLGDWLIWLVLAGRGWGKSRCGAEWVRSIALATPDAHIALVAPTAADARDVMVKAIVSCSAPGEVVYEPSKRALQWMNGARATTYSAEEPDRLRGPNHTHGWSDEICAWSYLGDVWDMLQMTLRIGDRPRQIVTTTPRPLEILNGDGKDGRRLGLLHRPDVAITRGSTFDNADNLSAAFLVQMKTRYEGTRLGDQELYGLVLDDLAGALFRRDDIDAMRAQQAPPLARVVVAVDPAVTSGENVVETGIVVAGKGHDGKAYVLEDATMRQATPDQWARRVIELYDHHKADRVVIETNQGGEMVAHTLRTAGYRGRLVELHVRRGKALRAEPVAALYEQRKVSHIGVLAQLETQMCRFMPEGVLDGNDDRVDALVHALTDLMLGAPNATFGETPWRAPRRMF